MSDENAPSENNQMDTEVPQITSENQGTSTLTTKKRKNMNEDSSKLDKAFKILESAASASVGNNESQSFGQFVGKKLETYNQQVRSIVQYEMSNILFKADYGYFNQPLTYQNNHNNYSNPSSYNNYNNNPQSYPTNIHSSSLPYPLPARDTNITSIPNFPVPQTSPATQTLPATFSQTSTPLTSPVNTYTSEELDFSDIM